MSLYCGHTMFKWSLVGMLLILIQRFLTVTHFWLKLFSVILMYTFLRACVPLHVCVHACAWRWEIMLKFNILRLISMSVFILWVYLRKIYSTHHHQTPSTTQLHIFFRGLSSSSCRFNYGVFLHRRAHESINFKLNFA